MKTLARGLNFVTIFLLSALAMPALSQTSDGLTPAEENVCDPLLDGTPGLYGLCVAYCEAHDAELDSLYGNPDELAMPDQRILDIYNKKKSESDPAMPCVLAESEACPCWSTEQLEELMPPTSNFDVYLANACRSSSSSAVLENFENGSSGPGFRIAVYSFEGCSVRKYQGYPGGPPSGFSNATPEEEESCKSQLISHARKYGNPGIVWDCFD